MQKVQNPLTSLIILLLFCVQPVLEAHEKEEPWWFSTETAVRSKYVWRGLNKVDDFVIQSSITVGYDDFSCTAWTNIELTDENMAVYGRDPTGEITEVNLSIDWARTFCDIWSVGAGIIHYTYPNTGVSVTNEIYALLTVDVFLNPSCSLYWDFDNASGVHARAGIGHTFEDCFFIQDFGVDIELRGSIGYGSGNYNGFYYGTSDAGFNDITLDVVFPIPINEWWMIAAEFSYSQLIGDVKNYVSNDGNFIFGILANLSF